MALSALWVYPPTWTLDRNGHLSFNLIQQAINRLRTYDHQMSQAQLLLCIKAKGITVYFRGKWVGTFFSFLFLFNDYLLHLFGQCF